MQRLPSDPDEPWWFEYEVGSYGLHLRIAYPVAPTVCFAEYRLSREMLAQARDPGRVFMLAEERLLQRVQMHVVEHLTHGSA